MSLHLRFCEACTRTDTRVRRALLLAHNLPAIEPSAAFGERLRVRLIQERAMMGADAERHALAEGRRRPLMRGAYAALAAGVLTIAGMAATVSGRGRAQDAIRLAPVVASLPEPSMLATSAMVASMPAGISVWPAMFVAQQAPWHFENDASGR